MRFKTTSAFIMQDNGAEVYMLFYIVTPCYNALKWLPSCIRSVADQVGDGVEVHHHVQDGLSGDGTQEWLNAWAQSHADTPGYTFTYESAEDKGMYDALNTAWSKMPVGADVTAHLNSDEQYLPDALSTVAAEMAYCPKLDIVTAGFIFVTAEGAYAFHRRPVKPHPWTSIRVCELHTCSTFHRAEPFRKHGIRFDTRFKVFGDVLFYRNLVCSGLKVGCLSRVFTSTFSITGSNLAWLESSRSEGRLLSSVTPAWAVRLHPWMARFVNGKRFIKNFLLPAPRTLAIYRNGDERRTAEIITSPRCRGKIQTEL